MRILFSMRHTGALRNFASTLRELAQRNHCVHLVFAKQDKEGDTRLLRELTSDPRITAGEIERKMPWRFWLGLARGARYSIDYLRYLTPEYEGVTSLTARARSKAPAFMCWLAERPLFRTRTGHRLLTTALLGVERAVPIDRGCLDLVTTQRPDVLLVTPLVDIGSDQVDYVKAARRLGIRCALPVLSWDNLTNKGLIRVQPDKVFVWNEAQKREAVELHGVRPENVIITGAMAYDQWFARTPSRTRDAFCARVGLDPATPILLYLCSSPFIAPDEVGFIEQWIAAIRSAPDPRVRTAGILIRPHPENRQPWHRFDAQTLHDVAVWPRGGASPVDAESKNDFYDSMYHAAAAVGINTSAQIECGIAGRPVFSIRTPAYRHSQEGTLHFRYLTTEGGGLLRVADDFDTHVRQLAEALDDPPGTAARVQGFVRAFTRPFGLDVAATPRFVDDIERFATTPAPAPRRLSLTSYVVRALLIPVGGLMVVARRFGRFTRKRRRQLRPVTVAGSFVKLLMVIADGLFRLRAVRTVVKEHLLPHAIARLSAANAPTEEAVAVRRISARIARHDRPIIVGPWVSEVGYELLYWIPFVRWVQTTRQIDPSRLVIVSRGGAGLWYGDLGRRYLDLFDHLTPEQFREKSEQRITDGRTKPRTMTEFDRETIKLTRQTLRLGQTDVLHPMQMYRLFHSFWQSRSPIALVDEFTRWQRLPAINTSDLAGALPDDFVAVRFHFNAAFPDTEANRQFVSELVAALSEHTDVVVLNPPLPLDDHLDVPVTNRHRVHRLDHVMSPRANLDVQTRVVARARAFVGTHGGFSYLPPLLGVKSISFYSDAQPVMMRHLEVAKRAFASVQPGSFTVLDVSDLGVLRAGLGTQHEAIAHLAKARLV
ncbi:MAG TPA: hypothetical protein VL173_11495 [Vicinamibacterales bacterium]|nr:hypothetical protein [Vicinamibacterales bacterium]